MVCAERLAVRAMGKFTDEWRGKSREERAKVPSVTLKVNEPWRRITGITVDIERCMDAKERRAGIRDLVKWIEEFTNDDCRLTIGERDELTAGVEMNSDGVGGLLVPPAPDPLGRATRGVGDLGGRMNADALGVPLVAATSIPTGPLGRATLGNEEQWACEGQAREVVVGVCAELNISRNKLSELIREVRGISATELIDGFRVRKIKSALAERVKKFARELWLSPGNYVNVLVSDKRLTVYGGGKSEYFVDSSADFYRRDLAETKGERMDALIKLFDAGWRRGGSSKDGFAVGCGFRSFGELNRACLNVWGKSARQVANDVCSDVIDYYLAREEEELRALACSVRVTPTVAKARYLYSGGTAAPEGELAKVGFLWDVMGRELRDRMTSWMDSA